MSILSDTVPESVVACTEILDTLFKRGETRFTVYDIITSDGYFENSSAFELDGNDLFVRLLRQVGATYDMELVGQNERMPATYYFAENELPIKEPE
jgi:hypothetical protein